MIHITPWNDRPEVIAIPDGLYWNDSHQAIVDKAKESEIAELRAALAQPAECGNTPYDEGPFTIAQPEITQAHFDLAFSEQQAQPEPVSLTDDHIFTIYCADTDAGDWHRPHQNYYAGLRMGLKLAAAKGGV